MLATDVPDVDFSIGTEAAIEERDDPLGECAFVKEVADQDDFRLRHGAIEKIGKPGLDGDRIEGCV